MRREKNRKVFDTSGIFWLIVPGASSDYDITGVYSVRVTKKRKVEAGWKIACNCQGFARKGKCKHITEFLPEIVSCQTKSTMPSFLGKNRVTKAL